MKVLASIRQLEKNDYILIFFKLLPHFQFMAFPRKGVGE